MRLNESTLCVLDFESTGVVAGHPNEPWQIGLVFLREGVVDRASMWHGLETRIPYLDKNSQGNFSPGSFFRSGAISE